MPHISSHFVNKAHSHRQHCAKNIRGLQPRVQHVVASALSSSVHIRNMDVAPRAWAAVIVLSILGVIFVGIVLYLIDKRMHPRIERRKIA